jgi:hypothetical protein
MKERLYEMGVSILLILFIIGAAVWLVALYHVVALIVKILGVGSLPYKAISGLTDVEQLLVWFVVVTLLEPSFRTRKGEEK